MLPEFLSEFSSSWHTIESFTQYMSEYDNDIKLFLKLSGEDTVNRIHEAFQQAIIEILKVNDPPAPDNDLLKLFEQNRVQTLKNKTSNILGETLIFNPDKVNLCEDFAEHMIISSFNPLLEKAKELQKHFKHSSS